MQHVSLSEQLRLLIVCLPVDSGLLILSMGVTSIGANPKYSVGMGLLSGVMVERLMLFTLP